MTWSTEVRNNKNRCSWNIIKKHFFPRFHLLFAQRLQRMYSIFFAFSPEPHTTFFLLVFERPVNKKYLHSTFIYNVYCVDACMCDCSEILYFFFFF